MTPSHRRTAEMWNTAWAWPASTGTVVVQVRCSPSASPAMESTASVAGPSTHASTVTTAVAGTSPPLSVTSGVTRMPGAPW